MKTFFYVIFVTVFFNFLALTCVMISVSYNVFYILITSKVIAFLNLNNKAKRKIFVVKRVMDLTTVCRTLSIALNEDSCRIFIKINESYSLEYYWSV